MDRDARRALTQAFPSGTGTGAGPCCLIGNDRMLRKLMSTAAGQRGTSGWRYDPRSGRSVYSYMGVPFYRTDVETDTTQDPDTTRLYAANLGPTGLNLVYAYGTPDSYGLEVQEVSAAPSVSIKELAVHGAYALALWEPEGLLEITGIQVPDPL